MERGLAVTLAFFILWILVCLRTCISVAGGSLDLITGMHVLRPQLDLAV